MNKWQEYLKTNDYLGVKQYIKQGGDVNQSNDLGESVLTLAIRSKCDDELIMLLINSGADIFDFDDEGVSIFDIAITYDNLKLVQYIINKGIDINRTTRRSGFTSLMAASCYGRLEIIKLLIENGADVNACEQKGLKAVDFARKMNKKSVIKLLE